MVYFLWKGDGMMKKRIVILMLGLLFVLGACSDNTNTTGNESDHGTEEVAEDEVNGVDQGDEEEEDDSTEAEATDSTDDVSSLTTPEDMESLFNNMLVASKNVENLTGVTHTKETSSLIGESETEVTSQMIFEPFVVHSKSHVTMGVMEEDTESYITEDHIYTYSEDSGWIKMEFGMGQFASFWANNDSQIKQFTNYADQFEMTEDADHYIVTFVGAEDMFNEIFFNLDLFGEVVDESLSHVYEDIAATGDLEMKIAKDTYLLMEQTTDITMDISGMINMSSETYTKNVYTYNNVDEIIIPEEALNAPDIWDSMPGGDDMDDLDDLFDF